ncbi:O-antigen ligase [uncultured Dialister sp.]|uniref:O-antigen ligase family protein n=1 Tax=uncultured Dialister sp. TaxID=278064 RepID=UPI0025F4E266|nr:O-antigen ligase family protein [uncultured Dialister sp.]
MANIEKVHKILFSLIVICIIFTKIPTILNFPLWGMGGYYTSRLVIYPLYAALIFETYTLWKTHKDGSLKFTREARYSCFYFLVYFCILFISLCHGLTIYPYMDAILHGPGQIEKIPVVLNFLNHHGLPITSAQLTKVWIAARYLKFFIINAFLTFGASYVLFTWCCKNVKEYYNIVVKCIIISSLVMIAYSCIETAYLAHFEWAKRALTIINPILHVIKENGSWYPPLLWKNQLRSIFPEPSHFGIYASFALPFLWYEFVTIINLKKKIAVGIIIAAFTFFLFLTNARTAVALFLGEVVLLGLYVLYNRSRKFVINALIIGLISLITFAGAVGFVAYTNLSESKPTVIQQQTKGTKKATPSQAQKQPNKSPAKPTKPKKDMNAAVQSYVDSNLKSLGSSDQRSNKTRFSVMKADFTVGLEHPLLGVGYNLRSPYVVDKMKHYGKPTYEMKMWFKRIHEKGILHVGIPLLGNYTVLFAETGILGLLAWLFPPVFLIIGLLKLLWHDKNRMDTGFFLISLIGILASGIGETIYVLYAYWVLLALGYALLVNEINAKYNSEM